MINEKTGFYIYDEHDYNVDINNDRSRKYFKTGYKKLDENAVPRTGEITMIPAFTDHGKSSLLRNLAFNFYTIYPNMHTMYYAFEEQAVDTYTALVRLAYHDKNENGISEKMHPKDFYKHIQKNDAIGAEARGLQRELSQRIHVSDRKVKPSHIAENISQMFDTFPDVEIIMIDYLQDLQPDRQMNMQHAEIEEMLEAIEEIAKEHLVAVLLAAQYRPDAKGNPEGKKDLTGLTRVFGSSSAYKKAKLFYSLYNETAFERTFNDGEANPLVQKIEIDILKQKGQRYAYKLCFNMCSRSNRITECADFYN